MELSEKDEEYIISLIERNKKLQAISFLHKERGMGLEEAKEYADKLNFSHKNNFYSKSNNNLSINIPNLTKKDEEYILSLIERNKKLQAVAFLHKERGMSLKEAKEYTDKLNFRYKDSFYSKFNNNSNIDVPNLSGQKKAAKIIFTIFIIFIILFLVQICFLYEKLFELRFFLILSVLICIILLILYFALKANIRILEKRAKEIEKLKLPDEFEIKSFRRNMELFFYVILFIFLSFGISIFIKSVLKEPMYKNIFYIIFLIGIIIFNFYEFLEKIENRKYSLNINSKSIKILYENNEIKFIRTDNISFVVFYAKNSGKRNVENKPTLQIFDNEQKMLVEMTVKIMDYHLLKKYFTKFNVSIKDQYNRF